MRIWEFTLHGDSRNNQKGEVFHGGIIQQSDTASACLLRTFKNKINTTVHIPNIPGNLTYWKEINGQKLNLNY